MAHLNHHDSAARPDCDERLVEERFLLLAQTQIQKLLNDKKLRYRDLAKRLGVSEARVSQMFGDEASNLTIRTIARIFHQLGETPILLSERELKRKLRSLPEEECEEADGSAWQVLGSELESFTVINSQFINRIDERVSHRAPKQREWVMVEAGWQRRA